MDWKDVAHKVADFAPLIGGVLLPGPAGAAVGALVASTLGTKATPDDVAQALVTSPDAAVKLRELETQQRTMLAQLAVHSEANRLQADTNALQAVNATMQGEAKGDHWPTYTWRPFIGFAFGATVWAGIVLVLTTFVALILNAKQASLMVAQLPIVLGTLAALGGSTLPVLGVASYFRGKMQADPSIATDNRG